MFKPFRYEFKESIAKPVHGMFANVDDYVVTHEGDWVTFCQKGVGVRVHVSNIRYIVGTDVPVGDPSPLKAVATVTALKARK